MLYSSPKQLCFPPVAGHTLRADFEGGALSSDFGALLLRGVDRQIGLTERLTAAIRDKRHPSYIDHAAFINWPQGMQMRMTPITSAVTPCSNSGWSDAPWRRSPT